MGIHVNRTVIYAAEAFIIFCVILIQWFELRAKWRKQDLIRAEKRKESNRRITLVADMKFDSKQDEPLPPWVKYPDFEGLLWRMGPGESYLYSVFYPFWQKLSRQEKEDYIRRYEIQEDWMQFWKWNLLDVDDVSA